MTEQEINDKIWEVHKLCLDAKEIHINDAIIKGEPAKIIKIYLKGEGDG